MSQPYNSEFKSAGAPSAPVMDNPVYAESVPGYNPSSEEAKPVLQVQNDYSNAIDAQPVLSEDPVSFLPISQSEPLQHTGYGESVEEAVDQKNLAPTFEGDKKMYSNSAVLFVLKLIFVVIFLIYFVYSIVYEILDCVDDEEEGEACYLTWDFYGTIFVIFVMAIIFCIVVYTGCSVACAGTMVQDPSSPQHWTNRIIALKRNLIWYQCCLLTFSMCFLGPMMALTVVAYLATGDQVLFFVTLSILLCVGFGMCGPCFIVTAKQRDILTKKLNEGVVNSNIGTLEFTEGGDNVAQFEGVGAVGGGDNAVAYVEQDIPSVPQSGEGYL